MEETDDQSNWTLAEATDEDGIPTMFRIRQIEPVGDQQEKLNIIWEYGPDCEFGMPSEDELSRMNECEELLTEFQFESGTCCLVAVLTGDGIRQWILYSSDIQSFGDFVNDSFPAYPPYPIEINHESDPEWNEYNELSELLRS